MNRLARVAAMTAVVAVAAACGGSSSGNDNPTVAQKTCPQVPTPKATPQQYASEPAMCIEPANYTATIKTNQGTIVATLDGAKAPHTVNSFNFLAGQVEDFAVAAFGRPNEAGIENLPALNVFQIAQIALEDQQRRGKPVV